jgi:hypothetical protein
MSDRRFFNIEDLQEVQSDGEPEAAGQSGILIEKFLQLHERRIESVKALAGRLPVPGEIFFLWTVNSFNAFTFIPYVIRQCGRIDSLILATYSINIRIIDSMVRLIDRGLIGSVDIFLSDTVRKLYPRVNDHLVTICESKPVRVRHAWTHAKIALISSGHHRFIVEGSGNWGENARHEQYIFLDSPSVFEFRKNEIFHGIDTSTT